jgi:hypothetical protein
MKLFAFEMKRVSFLYIGIYYIFHSEITSVEKLESDKGVYQGKMGTW